MKTGEIYWVTLDPAIGDEIKSESDLGEMKKAIALILDIDPEDCE